MSSGDEGSRPVGDGVRIERASALVGVSISTMRSWERQYGLPVPQRSAGGHRRYSPLALDELRLMRDEVVRGDGAASAARSVRRLLDSTEPGAAWIALLLAASRGHDRVAMAAILDTAEQAVGLGVTVDEIMMPALRQLGAWRESGRCDAEQEGITWAVVRVWLARREVHAPRAQSLPPVLIACGPRDRQTIGPEALAAILAHRRRRTMILGADTTPERLLATVREVRPSAVAIVSHLTTNRRVSTGALRALAAIDVPLFYAGNAFMFPGIRASVPGTYLGESLVGAADLLEACGVAAA